MQQLDMFGSELHEYLICVEPDQQTTNKVIQLKHLLHTSIPLSDQVLKSKPHISLCYFEASDFSDELIILKIKQALAGIECFKIGLNGCELWNNGSFILKVDHTESIHMLQKQLSAHFKGVVQTLHLTIARTISRKQFADFSANDFQYSGNFSCDSIVLLKKSGNTPYQLLHRILLSSMK
ncbi:2'-5' RNA ligase family protein [Fluviicola chungangensis]|uniref:2'-5' RNA ligase family protein n=1 Tax=Fluviicola chungangensis TaxID=2597671 RepID=A0A556MJV6_9FLAO|nr:2'-5' RNA ligase family protein [Fluviicola chungangensis]TSJ40194.1 2'-5' RNA ligase family protein [Fluviicola chungangensis]